MSFHDKTSWNMLNSDSCSQPRGSRRGGGSRAVPDTSHSKSNVSSLLEELAVSAVMCKADSTCAWVGNSSMDNKGVVYSPNVRRAGRSYKIVHGKG